MISTTELFGMKIARVTMREAVEQLLDWCREPRGQSCQYVVTPNVDHAVMFQHRGDLREAYADAAFVLADGAPIVAASRLLCKALPERVAGSDLVPKLFDSAHGFPLRVFLLGAAEGVAEIAAQRIHKDWPEVRVVGTYSPPLGFEKDTAENARILNAIAAAAPDLLVVGLGAPKQELWVHRHQREIHAKVALCAGATIDFLAGHRRRSPVWMRRTGLEWLHRVAAEPRRLAARYARDAWEFPQLLWQEWRGSIRKPIGTAIFAGMPADNILVLVVDGLRASALGAYGNTTFSTPALDQFAAESFLLDSCFAESTELPSIYQALWRSFHPLRPDAIARDAPSLPRLLAGSGYQTTLITDETDIVGDTAAGDFDECIQLDGTTAHRVEDASDTCLARICAAASEAIQLLEAKPAPQLVWVHSRGMFGPWDAPLELQRLLLDQEEGDPAPFDGMRPPNLALDEVQDPDLAYAASCAYAAQIMVLDACVDGLVERVKEVKGAGGWLVLLVGCRGFGLGEHGWIGSGDGRLSAELLHVPMLWRFPNGTGALARSACLSSHLDLGPTLLDWVGVASAPPALLGDGLSLLPLARDARVEWRDALLAANSAGERVIRTADWCLRRGTTRIAFDDTTPSITSSDPNDMAVELFVRPDDRWEANNVASLCQDEVVQLSQSLNSLAGRYLSGEPAGQAKSSDSTASDRK